MNDSDISLIDRFLWGDKRSLEILIERHLQGIFSICLRICEDTNDAHDITQDVCVKIMKHLSEFKGKSSYKTWVYRIAYNESLNFLRSYKESVDLEEVAFYLWESDVYDIDQRDTELIVQKSINGLPKIDKTIVLLFYYDELKIREIAEVMNMNENTIKTRLSRAKTFLQTHLEPLWKSLSKPTTKNRK